jgi:A/G-specific adenine glycosylase
MLQQTRVAAVLPYYKRFLKRFPNVHSLARAREHDVLKCWAGLGYYSRARNLHRAAKEIVAKYGGEFPGTREEALTLPGVGEYTAAAVLSIAYGEPLAVLDGNVARVIARICAIREEVKEARTWKRVQDIARALMPNATRQDRRNKNKKRNRPEAGVTSVAPGDWNQAMMELGATVCTPHSPRCDICPVARLCQAHRMGVVEQIPAQQKKRATEKMTIAAAVLLDPRGRTMLVRQDGRAGGEIFSRMLQFPATIMRRNAPEELLAHLSGFHRGGGEIALTQRAQRTQRNTEKKEYIVALQPVKHVVTYRKITILPHLIRVPKLTEENGERVLPMDAIGRLPVSNATRKIADTAKEYLMCTKDRRE